MRRILITGGAGFIGSHFVKLLVSEGYFVVSYDKLTYAGSLLNLKDVRDRENFVFIKGDITDRTHLKHIVEKYEVEGIANFAAETHVDRSILNPEVFYETNIKGVFTLLEIARTYNLRFLQVSTDEVYGPCIYEPFHEDAPLHPTSPYAATKASADLITLSYHKTFGLDVVITRSSNNFGPFQYPEKFIPLVIMSLMEKRCIPIYGNGRQKRDWIYVKDNVIGIKEVLFRGKSGEVYNIRGGNEYENIELVKKIIDMYEEITGTKGLDKLISFVKDRPAHDIRYAISTQKIEKELGFHPTYRFNDALKETVKWYIEHPDWLNAMKNQDFKEYFRKNYKER